MIFANESITKRQQLRALIKEVGLDSTIKHFQSVLDVIWSNVFGFPQLDSYLKPRIRTCPGTISSINTLYGISELCEISDFPDVYLLIRKLRDNLFLDLFLFEAQKTYERIPTEAFTNVDLTNIDDVMKGLVEFNALCVNKELNSNEFKAINKWKDNKLLMTDDNDKKSYFEFSKYRDYLLKSNKDFNECYKIFLKERFSKIGHKLNDYAHSNSEYVKRIVEKPLGVLHNIKETLIDIEQLFLISLFFVDSTLFSSEDYGDYIESNMNPPEGSQYWVNGYIYEVFMDIRTNYIDLFRFLISHNKNYMDIGVE